MLEPFVERNRFRGTCYQAANWHWVGETQGRSRNDRYNTEHIQQLPKQAKIALLSELGISRISIRAFGNRQVVGG